MCSARRRRTSAQASAFACAPSDVKKEGTNVTITTPPVRPTSSSTSSGTSRGTSQSARAEECEKSTGASLTEIAWRIVSSDTWLRSTNTPQRFSSRTTSSPKRVRPPCGWSPVAESAQAVSSLWVSVR